MNKKYLRLISIILTAICTMLALSGCADGLYTSGLEYSKTGGRENVIREDEYYYAVSGLGEVQSKDIIVPIMRTGRYVVRISGEAFKGTDIKSVTLPESIIVIASRSFKDCTNLKSINVPPQVYLIGVGAFEGCTSLTSVVFEDMDVWYIEDEETGERTRIDVSNASDIATKLAGEYSAYRLVKE